MLAVENNLKDEDRWVPFVTDQCNENIALLHDVSMETKRVENNML